MSRFVWTGFGFLLVVLPALHVAAQPGTSFVETALTPSSNPSGSFFGAEIEASGGVALVSARGADRVHVFVRGASWTEDQILTPDAPIADEGFGYSMAMVGDTILVGAPFPSGAPRAENGSVYVFSRSGGSFAQTAQLTPPPGSMFLRFGWSVALYGEDVAFVGAPHAGAFAGMVFRFQRAGGRWSLAETIEPAAPPPGAEFGGALSLDGDTLLVGAIGYDDPGTMRERAGAVYVLERARGWTETQVIRPAGIADRDDFGYSLALRGDTALIGARGVRGPTSFEEFAGAAYVFERSGPDFVERETLRAPTAERYAFMGWDVALGDDVAYVGAIGDSPTGEPARVYPFARTTGGYVRGAAIVAEGMERHDSFGQGVATDGTSLFVGEPARDAAWVYEVTRTCTVDADCADFDACTTDACTTPSCVYTPVPGCGLPDAGVPDAGSRDGGTSDGGTPTDAGVDAGASADAGVVDGGGGCHVGPIRSRSEPAWFLLLFVLVMRRPAGSRSPRRR